MVIAAFAAMNVVVLLLAGAAMRNAARQRRNVHRAVAERRANLAPGRDNPFAIFDEDEMRSLSVAPARSQVFGTRLFGPGYDDPWRADLKIASHWWPVYANKLRDSAIIGSIVTETIVVVCSGFVGVATTTFAAAVSHGNAPSERTLVLLIGAGGIAALAVLFRLLVVRGWAAAGDRYRDMALARGTRRERANAARRKLIHPSRANRGHRRAR